MKAIIIMIFILFAAAAYADESYWTVLSGNPIDLKLTCDTVNPNGYKDLCSPSATCNITINDPNGNNLKLNQPMTNSSQYFNYSLSSLTMTGKYQTIARCCDGGNCSVSYPSIQVNVSKWNGITPMTLIIALGIMAALSILIAYVLPSDHNILRGFLIVQSIIIVVLLIPASLMSDTIILIILKYNAAWWKLLGWYGVMFMGYFCIRYLIDKFKGVDNGTAHN